MTHLSVRVMTLVTAILWGGCLLFVGVVNLAAPPYGIDFLRMMSSVYPGYHTTRTVGELMLGTVYGFVDGAIAGCLFACLYNWIKGIRTHSTQESHS